MLEARLWKVLRRKEISWYRRSKYFGFVNKCPIFKIKLNFFNNFFFVQVHLHNKYTKYALLFFLCELLNLFVVVFIVFLIDRSVATPRKCLKVSKLGFWTTASLDTGMACGDTTAFHMRREGPGLFVLLWSILLILGSSISTQCVKSSQGWHPATTKGKYHMLPLNDIVLVAS